MVLVFGILSTSHSEAKCLFEAQVCLFFPAAFISLLDNYVSDTGEPEIVTPEEVAENHKFLDSIIQTPTMKVPEGFF